MNRCIALVLLVCVSIVTQGCIKRYNVRSEAEITESANESIRRWSDIGLESFAVGRLTNEYVTMLENYTKAKNRRDRHGANPFMNDLYSMRWNLDLQERELTETINQLIE